MPLLRPDILSHLGAAFSGVSPLPSSEERVAVLLQEGDELFAEAVRDRHPDEQEIELLNWGMFDAVILIQGQFPQRKANGQFRDLIYSAYPNYVFDMPVMVDTRKYQSARTHPQVIKKRWQSLILEAIPKTVLDSVQFVRLDPNGKFYFKKMLDDDTFARHNGFTPLFALDPHRQLANAADAISAGLAFGRALGCDPQTSAISFGLRWTKLKNRQIYAWTSPIGRAIGPWQYTAHEDTTTSFVSIPLDTAATAIAPFVYAAFEDLLINFGYADAGEINLSYVENFIRTLTKS